MKERTIVIVRYSGRAQDCTAILAPTSNCPRKTQEANRDAGFTKPAAATIEDFAFMELTDDDNTDHSVFNTFNKHG